MKGYTSQQRLADFETLADEKHNSEVFRASERIRLYVVALEENLSRARAEALEEAAERCDAMADNADGHSPVSASADRTCADAIRALITALAPASIPAEKVREVLRGIYETGKRLREGCDQQSPRYAEHTGRMGAAFSAARDLGTPLDSTEPNP